MDKFKKGNHICANLGVVTRSKQRPYMFLTGHKARQDSSISVDMRKAYHPSTQRIQYIPINKNKKFHYTREE